MFEEVVGVLNSTMGADPVARNNATETLQQWAASVAEEQGYIPMLLQIVDSSACAEEVRMAAAVQFKNVVKSSWDPAHAEHPVNEPERELVRSEIVGLMLRAAAKGIRNVIEEAIRIIAEVDFPTRWGSVVAEMVNELCGSDPHRIAGALSIAHGIFVRYRKFEELTEELRDELLEINRVFTLPLLNVMETGLANATGNSAGQMLTLVASAIEVFHDLVFLDMGEEHVELLDRHMSVLLGCIDREDPSQMGSAYEAGPLVVLKGAAMDTISHMLQRYDEEMEAFVPTFMNRVWAMLKDPAHEGCAASDNLVIGALDFLRCICQGVHHKLLSDVAVLGELCQTVVVPNMSLSEDEIDMFDNDETDYIERDIEGSDFHTRRRSAFELVRALMVPYEQEVGKILFGISEELLVRSSRGDWKAKNTAIYVLMALAIRGGSSTQRGVSAVQINSNVPLKAFFDAHIVPELSNPAPSEGSHWIIKADAMKFLTIFRQHLDASEYGAMLGSLTAFLPEPQIVVHTYAAHAIERLLMVVDEGGALKIDSSALQRWVPALLANLCTRLQEDKRPNAYTAQCLMRTVSIAPECATPYVGDIIAALAPTLHQSAKNPSDPIYSHNLFEAVSQTINADPSQVQAIEATLWDTLIMVLSTDVVEYVPYTLQILAQLLDANPPGTGIPEHYLAIAPPLTTPAMYENKGNIPAVIRLLCAFIKRDAETMHTQLQLTEKTVAVFQHLVALKQHDHDGLNLLTVMMIYYPSEIIDEFMLPIMHTLLTRLKKARTPKYLRLFNIFLGFLIVHRGAGFLLGLLESVQRGMAPQLLENIFFSNIRKVVGTIPRKVLVVAVTLLCECEQVQTNGPFFVAAVRCGLEMLHLEVAQDDHKAFAPKVVTVEELRVATQASEGFSNVFCPLKGAAAPPEDPCADVVDPLAFFKERVMSLLRANQQLSNAVRSQLPQDWQGALFS